MPEIDFYTDLNRYLFKSIELCEINFIKFNSNFILTRPLKNFRKYPENCRFWPFYFLFLDFYFPNVVGISVKSSPGQAIYRLFMPMRLRTKSRSANNDQVAVKVVPVVMISSYIITFRSAIGRSR